MVGIANTGGFRQFEYSPWRDPAHGGGDASYDAVYANFEVVPEPGVILLLATGLSTLLVAQLLRRRA